MLDAQLQVNGNNLSMFKAGVAKRWYLVGSMYSMHFFSPFLKTLSIVDLQCCVTSWFTAKLCVCVCRHTGEVNGNPLQ